MDTATSASFGQRWNQSIVQPDISPGNFSDRFRNFSPTCRKITATVITSQPLFHFSFNSLILSENDNSNTENAKDVKQIENVTPSVLLKNVIDSLDGGTPWRDNKARIQL